ncbi:MAG: AMP-binding protein [Phycisphaera sp.]|nr:AMP-binding protein [Phycisphaera sp.]
MSTIHGPILRMALSHPTQTAIIDDQRHWKYIELVGGAYHLAERLSSISESKHVGILLPTGGAFPMATLACWILGRVPVPINYLLSADERQYIVDDSGVDTVITAGQMLDFLGEAPTGVRLLKLDELKFEGLPPLRWPARTASSDDLATILYTSGTSGRPKGVMLTHRNLRSNVEGAVIHAGIRQADTFLGVLPQFHSFGLTALTLLPLAVGCKVVFTARFVPRKIVQLIRKHRPGIFLAIPSMYNALMTVKDIKPEDFKSLRFAISGGEPLPRSVADRFEKTTGVHILEGYGLTETSPIATWATPQDFRDGAVGKPIPGVDLRVIDEQGHTLSADQEGEVLIKGPNIMAGYYKMPDLTAEVIDDDGWFRTGDWGMIDSEGFLHITGRKKEMLIIGGENVFPREIEEVLNRHKSIKDSAVIGRMDESRGELPVAFVELNDGVDVLDETDVRAFCRKALAGYKVPKEINVLDALPRNPTGKIMRRQLKA